MYVMLLTCLLMLVSLLLIPRLLEHSTPRLLLAYMQLLRVRDASDMSADACVTSVDDSPVRLSLASAAAVACP